MLEKHFQRSRCSNKDQWTRDRRFAGKLQLNLCFYRQGKREAESTQSKPCLLSPDSPSHNTHPPSMAGAQAGKLVCHYEATNSKHCPLKKKVRGYWETTSAWKKLRTAVENVFLWEGEKPRSLSALASERAADSQTWRTTLPRVVPEIRVLPSSKAKSELPSSSSLGKTLSTLATRWHQTSGIEKQWQKSLNPSRGSIPSQTFTKTDTIEQHSRCPAFSSTGVASKSFYFFLPK